MPGIDGATVIRRIRLDPALRDTPCLLLTAAERPRRRAADALDAGADAFVRKEREPRRRSWRKLAARAAAERRRSRRAETGEPARAQARSSRVDDSRDVPARARPSAARATATTSVAGAAPARRRWSCSRAAASTASCSTSMMPGPGRARDLPADQGRRRCPRHPLIMMTAREDARRDARRPRPPAPTTTSRKSSELRGAARRACARRSAASSSRTRTAASARSCCARSSRRPRRAPPAAGRDPGRAGRGARVAATGSSRRSATRSRTTCAAPLQVIDGFSRGAARRRRRPALDEPRATDLARIHGAARADGRPDRRAARAGPRQPGRAAARRRRPDRDSPRDVVDELRRATRAAPWRSPSSAGHARRRRRAAWSGSCSRTCSATRGSSPARSPAPAIEVGAARRTDVVFFVRDNGAGFDLAYAERAVPAVRSGCTTSPTSPAPASASPPCTASSSATAAGSGPRARSAAARRSASPCARLGPPAGCRREYPVEPAPDR